MIDWWEKESSRPHYGASYRILDTLVYVAGRPDYEGVDKIYLDTVKGWMSLTDRFIRYPISTSQQAWFPWVESGPPKPEVIYGALTTLHYWIDVLKLDTIYIHCDAGTHRSPSIFGAYLDTYHPESAEEVAGNAVVFGKKPEHHSCAVKYWDSYKDRNPDLKLLTDAIREMDVSEWGHENLDSILDRVSSKKNKEKEEKIYKVMQQTVELNKKICELGVCVHEEHQKLPNIGSPPEDT